MCKLITTCGENSILSIACAYIMRKKVRLVVANSIFAAVFLFFSWQISVQNAKTSSVNDDPIAPRATC